jgi:hypothetical protein
LGTKTHTITSEVIKNQDNARFERFIELLKTLCLQIPVVDAVKLSPYSKYMKDIVRNKRKIPSEVSLPCLLIIPLKGKMPKKRGDLGITTIPCTIIIIMLSMLYVI